MSTKQISEVNDGGISVQVAGNFQQGLSFESVERLFQLLLAENFPKLQEEAAAKARQYTDELVRKTYARLSSKIEKISPHKMAEPDVQSTFNDAIQSVARKGEKANIDLLSDLLELRVENDNSNFLDICIEVAVSIVPKLTQEMLCALATVQFVQHLTIQDPGALEPMYEIVYREYTSKCDHVTIAKLMTISAFGAGSYMNIMGSDTFNQFKQKYLALNAENAKDKFPFMVRTLSAYDTKEMHKLSLNTPGQVIAITLLKKNFPLFDLKMLIE
ncbi:MAG: LPO_1073/Vpar_1526 family protein [Acidithiobacillus sp.]